MKEKARNAEVSVGVFSNSGYVRYLLGNAGSTSSLDATSNVAAVSKARDYWHKWFRWEKGRQGTGYDKCLTLASPFPVPFDCYLLRFPEGTEIPPHRDPVAAGRHYRLNIVVKRAPSGGVLAGC
jgi:hypothetical protein